VRRREAAEQAVEVRPPHDRAALDHRQPVRREGERGEPAAQLLRPRDGGAVQRRALALTAPDHHLRLDRRRPARPAQRHPGGRLPEAHELRVHPRPRREALAADVRRLEQVRLADAVRAHHDHESRLEVELEPLVRPEARERQVLDDQPASRIGMTR
jgi:hypothetical protein